MPTGEDDRREVVVAGFRIDAIDEAGRLVEIQSGALGPLRGKLRRLLPEHRLRIVKPVVLRGGSSGRRAAMARSSRSRRSPKRGALVDIFDDLMGVVPGLPPHQPGHRSPGGHDRRGAGASPPAAGLPGYRSLPGRDPRNGHARPPGDLWTLLPAACDDQRAVHDRRAGPAAWNAPSGSPSGSRTACA